MFKQVPVSTLLLVSSVFAALLFGFWGWTSAGASAQDSLYLSVTAFVLSDTYEFSSGDGVVWNWQIELARWAGFSAFLLGASKAVLLFFSKSISRAKARRRSAHIVVLGDARLAAALADSAALKNTKVNWLSAGNFKSGAVSKTLFVEEGDWDLSQAKRYGLAKTSSVLIAFRDDAKSIAIARQVRAAIPEEKQLNIYLAVHQYWLAMRIDEIDGVAGIQVISESQAAVRRIHRRHPPFLIAKNAGQAGMHSVIVGFGRWGEAVLVDSLLSCATSYLSKPKFTIIDPRAKSIQQSLKIRYPELEACADIIFIDKALSDSESCLAAEDICNIGETGSITACYVCLPDESQSLNSALALQTVANRAAWAVGPIFVRLSTAGSLTTAPAGASQLNPAQMITFGESADLIEETGILTQDSDHLAKVLHKAYRNAGTSGGESNVAWNKLPEDKKDSNRRVAMHLPAKLSSAGVDIEPWLQTLESKPDLDNLPEIERLFEKDEDLEKLAALEHNRWMVDRRISGWSYNSERDDKRRYHPDLVPYDQLSEQSKSYDREVVKTLSEVLSN